MSLYDDLQYSSSDLGDALGELHDVISSYLPSLESAILAVLSSTESAQEVIDGIARDISNEDLEEYDLSSFIRIRDLAIAVALRFERLSFADRELLQQQYGSLFRAVLELHEQFDSDELEYFDDEDEDEED